MFWALDAALANRRHFPAINWLTSYSLYLDNVTEWYNEHVSPGWRKLRDEAMVILQKEAELQEIVQLVGPDALPPEDQVILEAGRMLREDYLQQNAFHEVDAYCSPKKQFDMLRLIMMFVHHAKEAIKHKTLSEIATLPVRSEIARMKYVEEIDVKKIEHDIVEQLGVKQ